MLVSIQPARCDSSPALTAPQRVAHHPARAHDQLSLGTTHLGLVTNRRGHESTIFPTAQVTKRLQEGGELTAGGGQNRLGVD